MIGQISRRSWIAGVVAASVASGQQDWQPALLTPAENEALISLGERIIPGSAAAQTNRVIDLVLKIESPETQTGFRNALKAFTGTGFQQLSPPQQNALLTRASNSADPLHSSFLYLKEWLADAFWTSKQGHRELGFDGQMAWPEFNPCPHPSK